MSRVTALLFVLFTVIPTVETWLIIKVGSQIGATETISLLLLAAGLGAWLGKRAGFGVLRELMDAFRTGQAPGDRAVEAGLVLMGAILLITPGYLTDLFGLLLFIRPLRRALAPPIKRVVLQWLVGRGVQVGPLGPGPGFPGGSPPAPEPAIHAHPKGFDHPQF